MKRGISKGCSPYTEVTYEELGDYVGRKSIIKVNNEWFEAICYKECSKCKNLLQLEEFNNDKRRKFGKRSQCKSCYKDGCATEISSKAPDLKPQEESKIEYKLIDLNDE